MVVVPLCPNLIQVSSGVVKLGGGFLTLKMVADMSRIVDGLLTDNVSRPSGCALSRGIRLKS